MMRVTCSPKIFGRDVHIFWLKRWFEDEGEQLSNMNKTVDLVFHSGK
jgi:hypothetical protein